MISVKFYNNRSDNDDVHKSITHLFDSNCEIFGDCSIQSPRLLITMSDSLINANYVFIPKFNRYYYIQDSTIYDGAKVVVTCKVDVLMSFWDSFKGSKCIAKRSTSNYNPQLVDNAVAHLPQPKYIYRKLNASFTPSTSGSYVLTVGGR